MAARISRFLDIEAAVHDSSDESEDESVDFLDDSDITEPRVAAHQWKELEQWNNDETPAFLHSVAQAIEARHRSSLSSHQDEGDHHLQLLTSDSDLLWRVKVKVGSERDVVLAILQKAILLGSSLEVRAVFSRDTIHGAIYAEANSKVAVERALRGIPDVARRSRHNTFLVESVDLQDRPLLLDPGQNSYQASLSKNHWARVKRGRYKHDLCLIRNINQRTLQCEVTLVPRLNVLNKKRKRSSRSPQQLFDVEEVTRLCGAGSVTTCNDISTFRGRFYRSGLYETSFLAFDLNSEGVNATEEELKYFRVDKDLWSSAEDFVTPIRIGDMVRIIRGELQGMLCRVMVIKEMTVTLTMGDNGINSQDVMMRDVRRVFKLGDFVQVVHGPSRGASGFIIDIERGMVTLYSRVLGVLGDIQREMEGSEITVALNHVDWKSTPGAIHSTTTIVTPSTLLDTPRGSQTPTEHPTAQVVRMAPRSLPDPIRVDDYVSQKMYTGDRYRHMEVVILKGDAKRHFGMVKGSHQSVKGETLFDVMTSTRTVNTVITYQHQELRERHTGLPLERARWIPPKFRQTKIVQPAESLPPQPPTPLHSNFGSDDVFTPSSMLSMTSVGNSNDFTVDPVPLAHPPTGPQLGEWLLDQRLANRKLDVRIRGTADHDALWQRGRYEGQEGFLVFFWRPNSVNDTVVVKVGYNQSRIQFQPWHLHPETTIDVGNGSRPALASTSTSTALVSSIVSVPGTRVVIIGPDITNSSHLVGNYGIIVACPYALGPGQASIQIASPGPYWGTYAYFHPLRSTSSTTFESSAICLTLHRNHLTVHANHPILMSAPVIREIFIARETAYTGFNGSISWRWQPYTMFRNLPPNFIGPGTDVKIVTKTSDMFVGNDNNFPRTGPVIEGRLVKAVAISLDGRWIDFELLTAIGETKILALPTSSTTTTFWEKILLFLKNMIFFCRGATPTPHQP